MVTGVERVECDAFDRSSRCVFLCNEGAFDNSLAHISASAGGLILLECDESKIVHACMSCATEDTCSVL